MGGYFAHELKRAGFDHLVLEGRADAPVYLWIHDGVIQFRDASAFWMKTVSETEVLIHGTLQEETAAILSIGPAGANLVRVACIIGSGGRAAGRCGLGAALGAKRVKAIAVKGSMDFGVAQPEAFRAKARECTEKILRASRTPIRRKLGTIASAHAFNQWSATPYRNFQDEYMDQKRMDKIGPDAFAPYIERQMGCAACPIGCHHTYRIKEGPYAGTVCAKLEANTLWDFGTKLDLCSPEAILHAQELCREYGLDIDGTSAVVAWAIECFEKGILTRADIDGLTLRWGDADTLMALIRQIAFRKGFGALLGEGVKIASETIGRGSENYAFHIKGQALIEPMRVLKAWALGIAVSPRGATHTRGAAGSITRGIPPETGQTVWNLSADESPESYEAAPKIVAYYERFHAVLDSLGICFFGSNWSGLEYLFPEDLAELVSHATGEILDAPALMGVGEKIHQVEKAFNLLHANFSREDDRPPERFLKQPVKTGPFQGERLNGQKWETMLGRYYGLHGWDEKTGRPKKETLLTLGLSDVAEKLETAGRLGD